MMFSWRKLLPLKKNNKKTFFQKKIEVLVGYEPYDVDIFRECFTHTSVHQNKDFERLEFLGDSVLNTIISDYLFNIFPDQKEGFLTQMRSKIVNRKRLNKLGKELGLSNLLFKEKKNVSLGENINGNLYEALVGAIYIDKGFEACRDFINNTIVNKEDINDLEKEISSYKVLILEWTQKNKHTLSFETNQEENAEKTIIFESIVKIDDKVISKGRATSKKKAEEVAAKRAYYYLNRNMLK